MGGWRSVHAVCIAGLVLATRVSAQSPLAVSQRQLVPSVIGLTLDSARRVLTSQKLVPQVETNPRGLTALAQDVVTRQTPAARQPVPTNRIVAVEVTIVMPNVVGQNISRAREVLASRGIKTAYTTEQVVGAVSDVIVRQDPAAGVVVSSSLTAHLTGAIGIGRQPPQQLVPSVVGRQVRDASALLTKYGFRAGRITDDDDANVDAGTVVTQNPTGGQRAQTGTSVALSVRTTRVRVPSVLTLAESDARQQIAASGLRVSTVEPRDDAARPGTVIDQSPVARTPVQRGSDVSIVIARQAALAMPNLIGLSRAIVAVVVTPARAELRFGDSVRFTATATLNDGTHDRARVTWFARGGGTIRQDGMFTAVGDSGSHDVVATTFAGVAGTATVRVTLAPVLPLPPRVPPVTPWWERLWVLWVALGVSILAVVAKLLWPPPLPPITYALRTKPPSFSVDEEASGRGLALSLSLTNDGGVQRILETPFNAP